MSAFAIEAATDPLLGKVLQDRYRVVRKLGEGGMGAVYEGEHLVIKKRVAIKVLHPQFATSADIVARFHQEALAATAIGHEHIVEVNDMGRTPEGAIFMVLEFLAGTDFAGLLEKEHRLSVARAVHIVSQVCEGVQAAHDKGIVHRDLKPENVFLIRRGTDHDFAKVLDFGISKFQEGADGHRSATKTGSILGTAYYMSPEQAQGKKSVDHRSDVWAIGVILYKALTGRYPFEDEAFPMLILKICTENPAQVRTLRPDVPEELASVIARCVERDVNLRVQSCKELRALLAPFAGLSAPPPVTNEVAFAATMASDAPVSTPPKVLQKATAEVGALARPTTHGVSGIRPSTSTPRWLPIAVLTVTASVLAGGGVWYAGQAPAPVAEPVTPPPDVVTAPEPLATEELEFIVSPSEAVVLIDGRPVPSRADGRIARVVDSEDAALHELRIEARGFRTHVEDIRLSYHQRIVLALDPGTGVDDRRGSAPPAPPAQTGHRPRTTAGTNGLTGPRNAPSTDPPSEVQAQVATRVEPAVAEPPETQPETPSPDVVPPPRAGLKRVVIP
jgi:serine/threonine-protein kinase